MKHKYNSFIVIITQWILVAIFRVVGLLVIRNRNIEYFEVNKSKRYIIVSNHRWFVDPYLICTSLYIRQIHKLLPYRFFVLNRFYNGLFVLFRPFLYVSGCFPARWHPRLNYGLTHANHLLESRNTLVIFPEGRVSKKGMPLNPRKGVEVLAQPQDILLIPVHVNLSKRKTDIRRYSISIGQPFSGKNMTAQQIMDVVYSLKFR